jgi:hypothetical protein
VLIPKVLAEVAILVANTSRKILSMLKRLFEAIKRIGGITKQLDGILAQIGQHSRDTIRLQAFRLEAAGAGGSGWSGFRQAYNTLSRGNVTVYNTGREAVINTARDSAQTNTAQNSGQAGDTLRGNNPAPTDIDLPL